MAQKNDEEKMEEMMDNYRNIREALTGLYEIININFVEQNIYHQVAMDNLKALHEKNMALIRRHSELAQANADVYKRNVNRLEEAAKLAESKYKDITPAITSPSITSP